ncbi:DNA double-strand break repair nuclease NurA [Caloramator sp. CAR-1]|uniref:DNA double-strand break repair nuclease NurA n=1 Tax=Caloramator sp. CAR-1 TaxID=3062777 RepID=UPI0026E413BB|nr:DNA double-strand break repair nuclease NurA [Caloramator sp. CAR-1]MDO6355009.1 DNA double-strand break repair nuclease NurA [Caloramator sp. CAR-1]
MFEGFKVKLSEINERLKGQVERVSKREVESIINDFSNKFKLKRLSDEDIKKVTKGFGIIGVDGSINNFGGLYPHYISIVQALAKSTLNESYFLQDVYAPLFEDEDGQLKDEQRRRSRMSRLELEAASYAVENFKSDIILLDGSLMHYGIDCPIEWQDLKEKAIKKGKILIGVAEEVKTKDIAEKIRERLSFSSVVYDREVLFGLLNEGEVLEITEIKTEKTQKGIKTLYGRFSKDPQVIGLDFLEEQFEEAVKYLDLLYTLTPRDGRGIPLWLDIVDKDVKVTDDMVKALVETYIDRDIRERFFNPKRNKR